MIGKALERGAEIKVLLARKDNPFLKDIARLENRDAGDTIDAETDEVHEIIESINKNASKKMNVRYFSSEYRLPVVIATFGENSENPKTRVWLNVTLPPAKAREHLLFRIKYSEDELKEGNENFACMARDYFDSIWENGKTWEETAPVYWNEKYRAALENRVAFPEKILIQIAAQHPLVNGELPNEEFIGRLHAGIELYKKLKTDGKTVKIYVPGSIHANNGQPDSISLAEAGKRYLLAQKVSPKDIFADETNRKYKGSDGVYNSADECYVASMIYRDGGFDGLCCFCSPAQVLKNQLFFLENGILAEIYSVPSSARYHNPYYEAGVIVPEVLHYDHSWQRDSFYGEKTRKERKPEENSVKTAELE